MQAPALGKVCLLLLQRGFDWGRSPAMGKSLQLGELQAWAAPTPTPTPTPTPRRAGQGGPTHVNPPSLGVAWSREPPGAPESRFCRQGLGWFCRQGRFGVLRLLGLCRTTQVLQTGR